MSDDRTFLWLYEQLAILQRKVEALEGKCEQLRCDNVKPTLLCPSRREFDELQNRVAQLEPPSKNREI